MRAQSPGTSAAQPPGPDRPLGAIEQTLWHFQALAPDAGAWNEVLAVFVDGTLALPALTRAFHHLVSRRPELRTTFRHRGGEPVAVVSPPTSAAPEIPVRSPKHGRWVDESRAAAGRSFQLARELPVRATVLRYHGMDTVVLACHHLAGDARRLARYYHELAAGYEALATGRPVPPELTVPAPAPPAQAAGERSLAYWRRRLAGFHPARTALAIGRQQPQPTFAGAAVTQSLGPGARVAARSLVRRLGIAESVVLLAAYYALLACHGAGSDLTVGVPVGVGEPADAPSGISPGLLPVRTRVDSTESFATLAAQVRAAFEEAARHRDAPYEALLPVLEPARHRWPAALLRYTYDHRRAPVTGAARLGGLPARAVPVATGHSPHDLALVVESGSGRTGVRIVYRTEVFDEADARALVQRFDALLCRAGAAPERSLAELSCWTSADRAIVAGARRRGGPVGTRATTAAGVPVPLASVRDAHGRPLPPGVRGDLCLASDAAAADQPPWEVLDPGRCRRTGARARWSHDGRLDLLGDSAPTVTDAAGAVAR